MSDEELSPEEILIKKHRKEKKDLQGQIQGMKKTASKGDKKKKKEVTEEIAKLEKDLEERHKKELEELKSNPTSDIAEQEDEGVVAALESATLEDKNAEAAAPQQKVSKAQKRRDKKAQKDKEREAEIEAQELINLTGTRQTEGDAIRAKLTSRGLALHEVVSDGDCLYAGVAHQLALRGQGQMAAGEVRKVTADTLRAKRDDYLPFLTDPKTGDLLDEAGFEQYCNDLVDTKVWGGQVELRAISEHFHTPIEVIQAEGTDVRLGEGFDKEPLVLTYHRHIFGLGEHYNSTRPSS